jgi:hypothetical protein
MGIILISKEVLQVVHAVWVFSPKVRNELLLDV